jgi:hypothetical protein
MQMLAIFGVNWLHMAIYEGVVIVALVLAVGVLWIAFDDLDRDYRQAKRERDEAKETLGVIQRMSEIRVETVTRLRGFR